MVTELSAAVLTSILVGLAPAAWALPEPGSVAKSADLAEQPPSPAHSPAAVSDAVAAVTNADWNATLEAWKSQHPDAACQGPDDARTELLCQVCRVQSGSGLTEWSFFDLGDKNPPQCQLYQVRGLFRSTPEAMGQPELAGVETGLTARFGPPSRPNICETNEEWCGTFLELLLWEQPNLEVLAYRAMGPQTVVLARSAPLREARRMNEDGATSMESPALRRPIVDLIAADLGDRATRFRRAALDDIPTDEILAELLALLDAARRVEGPHRYALTLAADLVAERLAVHSKEVAADFPKGLTFEPDHLGDCLAYRHDLVQSVLRDAPAASGAHDLAFLMMLGMGLDTSVACDAGEDQFHGVVREASAFLSKRPDSKYRADVTYLLAQAYESWWSASLGNSGMAEPEKAREGAEAARKRAVKLYEEIVRAEPTSDCARYAKFALPLLKLRVDTKQNRFLCITC